VIIVIDPLNSSKSKRKFFPSAQAIKVFEFFRGLDTKFQSNLVEFGLLEKLKFLVLSRPVQNSVAKLVSHLDSKHQVALLEKQILWRMISHMNTDNYHQFLKTIKKFPSIKKKKFKKFFRL
jgi:hypothetical protein